MSKRYTNIQLKDIIRNVANLGYANIDLLAKELAKLQITAEEIKDNDIKSERIQKANTIVSCMTMINDIIHPLHMASMQLLDKRTHPFIVQCMKQHETARKNNIVSKGCPCCSEEPKEEMK